MLTLLFRGALTDGKGIRWLLSPSRRNVLCGASVRAAVIASLLRSASGSAPTAVTKVTNVATRPLQGLLPPKESLMSDITITETAKQIVITRLAAIDSATSILSLINGRPAKVIADEVITLAARIETWAWRALLAENPAVSQDEAPAESRQP